MPDLPRIRDKYYKQFDKYFIFVEQAIRKTKDAGYICYIVPNKFFKVGAGEHLRSLIAKGRYLVSLDDFGDAQLFEDKTIYSSSSFYVSLHKRNSVTLAWILPISYGLERKSVP